MTSVGWLLIAVAVLAVPGGRPLERSRPSIGASRDDRSALRAVAAVLSGGACAALLGPIHGGVAALVVGPVMWAAAGRSLQRPTRPATDPSVPLALDLAAAALHAGRPLADALVRAAPATRIDTAAELGRVAGLLRLGADPAQAWSVVATQSPLGALATVAVRSATSGIKLAGSFERLAADLRTERAAAGAVRAHRAGVAAMGPLAACFLPSFVCIGVVPVVAGIAGTALGAGG